jgi:hypothetical protein
VHYPVEIRRRIDRLVRRLDYGSRWFAETSSAAQRTLRAAMPGGAAIRRQARRPDQGPYPRERARRVRLHRGRADARALLLDDGVVRTVGTYEQLLATDVLYRQLASTQLQTTSVLVWERHPPPLCANRFPDSITSLLNRLVRGPRARKVTYRRRARTHRPWKPKSGVPRLRPPRSSPIRAEVGCRLVVARSLGR